MNGLVVKDSGIIEYSISEFKLIKSVLDGNSIDCNEAIIDILNRVSWNKLSYKKDKIKDIYKILKFWMLCDDIDKKYLKKVSKELYKAIFK